MNTATVGSMALLPTEPTPRIMIRWLVVALDCGRLRFGVCRAMSRRVWTSDFVKKSEEKVETEIGTFCTLSSRFCAVTVISSISASAVPHRAMAIKSEIPALEYWMDLMIPRS